MNDNRIGCFAVCAIGAGILAVVLWFIFGYPMWNVWSEGKEGEAALRRSESQKLVMVEQARAELESARLRADAIGVVGKAAQEFPEYRLQEFIGAFAEALREGNIDQIIYVPTEGNIPVLEAGRLSRQDPKRP